MVIKEMIKNILIKIPFAKKIAKRNHITGVNQTEEGINKIYETYTKYVGIKNKNVIELGPGHTYGVACKIKEEGANSVSIIDIERYVFEETLQKYPYLNYIIYNGKDMPVHSESMDVALSYTVYEHLRDPEKTVSETYRILKKGGVVVHFIDLCDHMFYGPNWNEDKILNCLRYSKTVWSMMSYNRSVYVNRLRQSEWVSLHKEKGFSIEHIEAATNANIENLFSEGKLKYLLKYKPEDRFISNILLVARKL
jgi:ubiquinone/menaquinone biosynthesis C-methylase UbiE